MIDTMPATRVTVASNSNQSLRAPLLLSDLDAKSSIPIVFKTAKEKLRLKKGSRIFHGATGEEISKTMPFFSFRQAKTGSAP